MILAATTMVITAMTMASLTTSTALSIATHATASEIESLLGCCPTCLSYGGERLPGDPEPEDMKVCPTCGTASVEWTLAVRLDEATSELAGYVRLERALLAELDD